jgi:hypothetical protein
MIPVNQKIKSEIVSKLNSVRAMRDEVRVQLHLAGMEAKAEWSKLEPQIEALEHVAEDFTDATHTAVCKAYKSLSDLKVKIQS